MSSSSASRAGLATWSRAVTARVFVNDVKFDDITTEPFLSVRVPNEQYFLLGDNRSVAIDSRTFGTVLGDPIFGKVFVTFWPLRDFSFRMGRESGEPPGATACD